MPMGGTPEQYVHFKEGGIDVISPGEIKLKGYKVILDAPVEASSTIKAKGDITDNSGSGGKSMANMRQVYDTHTHNNGPQPDQKTG